MKGLVLAIGVGAVLLGLAFGLSNNGNERELTLPLIAIGGLLALCSPFVPSTKKIDKIVNGSLIALAAAYAIYLML
nr:hypothetical protein [Sphingobium sp.]